VAVEWFGLAVGEGEGVRSGEGIFDGDLEHGGALSGFWSWGCESPTL
jgi:hypothetical protein